MRPSWEDRGSALAKMKEKQKHQEEFGKAMGPTKRYMPDEIIEKNFRAHEAKADAREAADKQRAEDGNLMMRRAIAEQVKEKQARLDAEREEESKRSTRFKRVVNTLEEVEKEASKEERVVAVHHKGLLEAQMRDNLVRKQVFPMTQVEKSLNADMLRKVEVGTSGCTSRLHCMSNDQTHHVIDTHVEPPLLELNYIL